MLKEEIIQGYSFSSDKAKLNVEMIYNYLTNDSYWAKGISLETVKRSIENSVCFGIYLDSEQVGFARVVTDKATYGYLGDLFVWKGIAVKNSQNT